MSTTFDRNPCKVHHSSRFSCLISSTELVCYQKDNTNIGTEVGLSKVYLISGTGIHSSAERLEFASLPSCHYRCSQGPYLESITKLALPTNSKGIHKPSYLETSLRTEREKPYLISCLSCTPTSSSRFLHHYANTSLKRQARI